MFFSCVSWSSYVILYFSRWRLESAYCPKPSKKKQKNKPAVCIIEMSKYHPFLDSKHRRYYISYLLGIIKQKHCLFLTGTISHNIQ